MVNTGARKKTPILGGIASGSTTEQTLKNLCEKGKDLSIAAIRGAQVTINLEDDFHNPDMDSHPPKPSVPMFVRSHQVGSNVDSGYILILQINTLIAFQ